ncbi:MAG: squalene/phytoene synthase family protein [Chromatiales bacterium]
MEPDAAIRYCREQVAAPGSDFYYATLFVADAEKARLFSLHAFAAELARIPYRVTDPGVARVKLAWCREDLARVAHGRAEHPVNVALAASGVAEITGLQALMSLGVATEALLNRTPLPDIDAVVAAHHSIEGTLWELSARVLGGGEPQVRGGVAHLGCALGLIGTLCRLREQLAASMARLPADLLARHGLIAEDLLVQRPTAAVSELATLLAGHARKQILDGLAALPLQGRLSQLPALIMTEISVKTLGEMQHEEFPVLERQISLTPLRKLWIAVRTRRRERRLHRRAAD